MGRWMKVNSRFHSMGATQGARRIQSAGTVAAHVQSGDKQALRPSARLAYGDSWRSRYADKVKYAQLPA